MPQIPTRYAVFCVRNATADVDESDTLGVDSLSHDPINVESIVASAFWKSAAQAPIIVLAPAEMTLPVAEPARLPQLSGSATQLARLPRRPLTRRPKRCTRRSMRRAGQARSTPRSVPGPAASHHPAIGR